MAVKIGTYETHPAADVLPLMEGPPFAELVADVAKNGVLEPVRLDSEGRIVDGRNRARACIELGKEIPTTVLAEDGIDVVTYVLAKNLRRRHLSPSQAAIVIDRLATLPRGRPSKNTPSAELSVAEAAKLVGGSPRSAAKVREIKKLGRGDLYLAVERGEKTVDRALREARRDEAIAAVKSEPEPMPTGPFRVVVLDPPWRYDRNAATDDDTDRRGEVDYADMSTQEIIALDVPSLLADDAIVWLWVTNAHFPDAVQIADAWALEWKTVLTWTKNRMGIGTWLRGKTEHAVLLTRGSPVVNLTNETTELVASVREHSRKPDEFYALVEKLCPGSKLEMFARAPRAGWATHGAERTKFEGVA
jgi:N6-adenosine-specific RNA methylase IME4